MRNGPVEDWGDYVRRSLERDRRLAAEPGGNLADASGLADAPRPSEVVRVLVGAGVRHALIGAHAVGMRTGAPRYTKDVYFIVDDVDAAAKALAAAFPRLREESLGGGAGRTLVDARGREVVDLLNTKRMGRSIAIPDAEPVVVDGVEVRVPTAEGLVALKYVAIRSVGPDGTPGRPMKKRMYDLGDILSLMESAPAFDANKVYGLLCGAFDADFAERWRRDADTLASGKVIDLGLDG